MSKERPIGKPYEPERSPSLILAGDSVQIRPEHDPAENERGGYHRSGTRVPRRSERRGTRGDCQQQSYCVMSTAARHLTASPLPDAVEYFLIQGVTGLFEGDDDL